MENLRSWIVGWLTAGPFRTSNGDSPIVKAGVDPSSALSTSPRQACLTEGDRQALTALGPRLRGRDGTGTPPPPSPPPTSFLFAKEELSEKERLASPGISLPGTDYAEAP